MKNYLLFVILFFIFQSIIHAQVADTWYFGSGAGVDFSGPSPVALTNGVLYASEGCTSISDNNSNLLFYTDGVTVYNSNHTAMPNGTGLAGGSSSNQAAIVVPVPGSNNTYYVFTTGDNCSGSLNYSIVDMTLAGGLGDVIAKNTMLLNPVAEKITAVKDANGLDYWVLVHEGNTTAFYAYKITTAGVSVPVVSNIGTVISNTDCLGGMKFNPMGTQVAVTYEGSYSFELYDFNKTTGMLSNQRIIGPLLNYVYSCEFSPNGHYLYGNLDAPAVPAEIYQYDVTLPSAAAINASGIQVGISTTSFYFGTMQNAPDGKIYVARDGQDYLGIINNPNVHGLACNYVDIGLSLASRNNTLGLPNFVTSIFRSESSGLIENKQTMYSVYPSPFSNQIFVRGLRCETMVRLLDIQGREIESRILSPTHPSLNTASVVNGVYLFEIISDKQRSVYKVLKL